jgi:predicted esterase
MHAATVIWLHGLGDSGNGWAPIAHELDMPHVKWVFPSAGERHTFSKALYSNFLSGKCARG